MTRGSILIVDDDPRLLHIVAMYLGIEGYDVSTAENGEDGLAQVEARAPDLVILDIMMPGMDGIETCKRIRGNAPTADVPIVMFSALSSDDDIERARLAGANHLITKPFNLVGLGSVVYGLCVMSRCLKNSDLLTDALKAADLFTDELIAADKQLDVIGGSAGGILGLLCVYRDTQSEDVLKRAIKCGEHLMSQPRLGPEGRRSWVGQGFGSQALNGMSHGAAGFAYALASLAAASGRAEFEQAAEECITFEDSSYDPERKNWPDLRNPARPVWSCRWCHGAPGIGLARLATGQSAQIDAKLLDVDIRNAVQGVQQCSPAELDTLCCGTLGSIEFFCEAGRSLDRSDLRDIAAQRLVAVLEQAAITGDYRWNGGKRQFNLGLFRGLSGVGYTFLRQIDLSLPNILTWQ